MGIEPTYPSEKYGYIIPESGENVSRVKEFKEKPDIENAKKYLAQSALWNAGIFAFKLGYLLDKAHSMIEFEDYRDLFNRYDSLTKISFDYAVVEKEPSIQVLRYSGDWKDVVTWNMMAEVMADTAKYSMISFFQLVAFISINLGVMNLLPLPALDGGRLVFLIIEGIRRKPVPPKYEGLVHAAGLMLLLMLMVYVTGHDILRLLTGRMMQ